MKQQPQALPSYRIERLRRGPWVQMLVPHGYEFNRVTLEIPGLASGLKGLKVLHLTDLHFKACWSRVYDQMIEEVNAADADLLLFTGDYNEAIHDLRPSLPFIRRFVEPLRARLGKFGIFGNHDTDLMRPYLIGMGLPILEGLQTVTHPSGATIELVGLIGVDHNDLTREFLHSVPAKQPGALRIVLSHYPDHVRRTQVLQPDIVLAGHTHGGQICLPGGIPLLTHDRLPKHQARGVHRLHDTWLLVNRGLGLTGIPLRVFAPAEMIELRLE